MHRCSLIGNSTLLPGYTHLQRAQPISLAHHLLAFAEMSLRDVARLKDAHKRVIESLEKLKFLKQKHCFYLGFVSFGIV